METSEPADKKVLAREAGRLSMSIESAFESRAEARGVFALSSSIRHKL